MDLKYGTKVRVIGLGDFLFTKYELTKLDRGYAITYNGITKVSIGDMINSSELLMQCLEDTFGVARHADKVLVLSDPHSPGIPIKDFFKSSKTFKVIGYQAICVTIEADTETDAFELFRQRNPGWHLLEISN